MTDTGYSLKRVRQTLGLSRAVVVGLIAAGFVHPTRGPRNAYRFSFRDLMLLRTAHLLREARVPTRRILRSLARLRARLPDELPLTGLRITAIGSDVAVRDRSGAWHAESGQWLIDFEVANDGGEVAIFTGPQGTATPARPDAPSPPETDADTLYRRGQQLEADDAGAAETAYRDALQLDPACLAAAVDLGVLLCEQRRPDEAAAILEAAIAHHPDDPLLHFNLAIASEDRQRPAEALARYEHALRLDAGLVDAHYNAGRLSEALGDAQGALRHFSAYRRLRPRGEDA